MLTTLNIDIQAMLVWLTLPFYDFCGFRSVAVNSVYKLQFFTFIIIKPTSTKPQVVKQLQKYEKWWHLLRLFVFDKTAVQQHSVETLHNKKILRNRKKHAKVICQYTSAYIAEQKTRVFVQWVQSFNRYWVERVLRWQIAVFGRLARCSDFGCCAGLAGGGVNI